MSASDQPVSLSIRNDIAWITVDSPPVNALGAAVREGLVKAVAALKNSPEAKGVILRAAGRTFMAGADISEFGKPMTGPHISEVAAAFEGIGKPTIAAIHGNALGGGLEIALGCHYRVVDAKAKVGFPEISLGIMPGAGGTQRSPRVMGVEAAMQLMLSGAPISAQQALEQGLVDEVVEGDLSAGAEAFLRRILDGGLKPVPVRDRTEKIAVWSSRPDYFEEARRKASKAKSNTKPGLGIVDAVEAAVTLPFDKGLARESEIFTKLMNSPESAAQRYSFFAERRVTKIPGLDPSAKPVEVARAAVLGAGQMGTGITTALLEAGIPVILLEQNPDQRGAALDRIRGNWANRVKRGSLSKEEVERRIEMVELTSDYAAVASVDLVIEAVWENMALKKQIFSTLDGIIKPGAILATNTSTLDVNEIARATHRPQDVIGLHFFSPAHVMRLLEVVRGSHTSDVAIATALLLAKRLRKVPVLVGVCHGFIGNRIFSARDRQAVTMLLEGATPNQIDVALEEFGFPMGTFTLYDMVGAIELGWRMRQETGNTDPIGDALYDRGQLGQRAGKGYYRYEPGNRAPLPDPEFDEIVAEARQKAGIAARPISNSEIIERMIYPMVNEAAKILDEKIAIRASDIDVVWLTGYGWPMHKGGPTYYGDQVGLKHIVGRLKSLQATHGDYFKPSPLLEQIAAEGGTLGAYGEGATL